MSYVIMCYAGFDFGCPWGAVEAHKKEQNVPDVRIVYFGDCDHLSQGGCFYICQNYKFILLIYFRI